MNFLRKDRSLVPADARPGVSWRSLTCPVVVFLMTIFLMPLLAHADTPPAGTVIGNQASATYTDGSGVQREATSNVALTTVQQVGAVLLTADQTVLVAPGGQVVFRQTVQNTGNGTDSFTLSATNAVGDDFELTNIHIYPDANQDGQPDAFSDITTSGSLTAGSTYHFVVVGNIPVSATSGQSGDLTVTATSVFDNTKTSSNTDTALVGEQAVLSVSKSALLLSGAAGITNTYTLTYVNSGNNTATNVVITDELPTGLTYVTNSGRWSVSGATVLTDAVGGDPAGINYSFSNSIRTVSATIASVPRGNTAFITFQVIVDANNPPGIINNTAEYSYDDGTGTAITDQDSNTVGFQVNRDAGVVINDNPLQSGDTTLDDIVSVTNANQGAIVAFTNRVHNTGNGTDTFNISLSGSTFPAGTSFQLYQSDGATPLVDSDGNSVPDTGPVLSNAVYSVVLKATLPPSASGNNGGSGFSVTVTATSSADSSTSDTVTDTLDNIGASSVDITNNSVGGPGAGAGPEAVAVVTNTANAGTTSRFTLRISNTSSVADTYNLAASTNSSLSALVLPTGWTVVFRNSGLTVISSTGVLAAGTNLQVFADVTIPANETPRSVELFFRALSPTTGAGDTVHNRVTINASHSIVLAPNNSGQVTAGGAVIYSHTLCNAGNVAETNTLGTADSGSSSGWSSLLYLDVNSNGTYESTTDTLISGTVIVAPGACQTIFTKVIAPAGAAVGSVNTTTISATAGSGATASATDTSTVISSDLQLIKDQALDGGCDGTPDSAYSTAQITTNAVPGACILYRIRVTNNSVADVTNVHVFDTTPAFTTYSTTANVSGGTTNTFSGPALTSTGSFDFHVGGLSAGATATITFGVKINP